MAAIGEIAVEILVEAVEGLIEEGTIEAGSEIATSLTELTAGEDESVLSNVITEAVQNGQSDGEALGQGYSTIAEIDQNAADVWATNMELEGYPVEGNEDPGDPDMEDTAADSDPDKANVEDSEACEEDPTGEACVAEKKSALQRFKDFFTNNPDRIIAFFSVMAGALTFVVGQIIRWVCQLINKIGQTFSSSYQPKKCDSVACEVTKGLVKTVRKYFIPILVILGAATVGLTYYTKSVSPVMLGGVSAGVVIALDSVLGNVVATTICNLTAVTDLFF